MSNSKKIPITILTGFLGSGKTTLVNKIIEKNKDKTFGVIVNEFGDVGIDNEIIEKEDDEIVELSNGCMCCIVRSDLYKATEKLLDQNPKIDYLLIETSGLSEAKPIADTYIMNTLEGRIYLDGIICVMDCKNHAFTNQNFKVAMEQIKYSDFVLLNKIDEDIPKNEIDTIKQMVKNINPASVILENDETMESMIDQQIWDIDRLEEVKKDDKAHHHDHHEHEHFDEVVFVSEQNQIFDAHKLDDWLKNSFPENCLRSKGIMNIKIDSNTEPAIYLFQMVGASKMLDKFSPRNEKTDTSYSRVVFIGKDLNKGEIYKHLNNCMV